MSQASHPTECRVGYLLKQAQQTFRRCCEERLRGEGVSMAQYAVLRALVEIPGATAAELARRTFVTRQSLRDVLRGLEAAGMVTVAAEATVGRARPVSLTDRGGELLARADAVVDEVEHRMLDGMDDGDSRRLGALLGTCVQNLER